MRVVIIISVLFGVALSNTTPPGMCVNNGKTYYAGQSFQPSPCEHCYCSPDGRTPCAIADCFFTPCVDSVHDPTKCCPVCPNGENCRYTDGTIIKKGEVYKPNDHTICQCPSGHFGFGTMEALCAVKVTALPPQTVQVVS